MFCVKKISVYHHMLKCIYIYDILCRLNSLTWMIHFVRQLTEVLRKVDCLRLSDFALGLRSSLILKSDFVRCHIVW